MTSYFRTRQWKYFSKPNVIAQQHNPDAQNEDDAEMGNKVIDHNRNIELYSSNRIYEVVAVNTVNVLFALVPRNISEFNVELKMGDRVVFKGG